VGLICVLASYELLGGTGLLKNLRVMLITSAMAMFVCLWSVLSQSGFAMQCAIFVFTLALFLELLVANTKLDFSRICLAMFAGIGIPYLLSAVLRILHMEHGRYLVLIPFAMTMLPDSGAYFIGCAFGKHKLAPTISPKKTWEGAVGGTAFALLLLVPYAVKLLGMPAVPALVCVFIGSVLGQIGDLLESKLKRWGGVKDSGNFFPGHGGVLDRLDSLMLACPAVLLMWYLFV
ncbi:MAG: phosphatidate cytidylyltransferase, partial [Firmicutes bacterium]|nr:phosphatidate cytidylyltransferase [Bacillota bacterium]